ncbi:unnamed protein product [Dimorphilus gyrociliatus]|uniref:Uncharacterized protein n=1 Tax=Dimorphilus gyrociliatus TaxID=2664684 RepID=A0A7I8VJX7_9ANNE|nr:unnamed protein product [Dimorphilus gyrociliatus]
MTELINLIKEGNLSDLEELLTINSIRSNLKQQYWDFIPQLCELLSEESEARSKCIEHVMLTITEVATSAKDLLIVFMEQFDKFICDFRFKLLLKPISKCLDNLSSKKGYSLGLVLSVLNAHIKSITIGDKDQDLHRIFERLNIALDFVYPFARQIAVTDASTKEYRDKNNKQLEEILLFVVKVLAHPLSNIDVTLSDDSLIKIYQKLGDILSCCSRDAISTIEKLEDRNQFIMFRKKQIEHQRSSLNTNDLENMDTDLLDVEEPIPEIGISMIPFLATIEGVNLAIPLIYRADFVTGSFLNSSIRLLKDTSEIIVKKGINIAIHMFSTMQEDSTSYQGIKKLNKTLEAIYQILLRCPNIDLRRYASKIVPELIKVLSNESKYIFFERIINHSHQAVKGYGIILLKNSLQENMTFKKENEYLKGEHLDKLFNDIFLFNVEKDILDNAEFLLDALSLFRYLISVDKRNETGIIEKADYVEKNFLKPLEKSIDLAKAHYQLEIQNCNATEQMNSRKEFLQAGIVRIEMIESILAICSDLKAKKK